MRQLRLPGFSSVTPFVALCRHTFGLISCVRSPSRGNRRADARVFVQPVSPSTSGVLSQGHLRFSQVSCEPLVHLPCSQTPAGPRRQADCGVSVLPSRQRKTKAPAMSALSELNHTAFALAVYASCRPLGRRRKTRFRWLANLSGWTFSCPLSSFGEFPLSLPLSQDLSWRYRCSLLTYQGR